MVRWEPGAKDRLQAAAIALFLERGYEETTVQEIAQEAGLTERTFFRHFADKREVLFRGQQEYVAEFLRGVREAPEGTGPLALAVAALETGTASFSSERRPWSRRRQQVIDANPALQERESLKRAALADALTEALQLRGVPDPDARLAAEAGSTAFHVAFRLWIGEDEARPLLEVTRDVLARMAALMPAGASIPAA